MMSTADVAGPSGASGPPVGPGPDPLRTETSSPAPVWTLIAAAVWSMGLMAAGLWISPSLVAVNGVKVLVPLGLPLAVVLLVSALLRFRTWRGASGAGALAWSLSVLLDLLALAGVLTIGIFVLPVAALVSVACALK
jgi:hypothetical protein